MHKILIIEDDITIATTIKNSLESWGYTADYIEDFQNVLSKFASYNPHLVLLDISLPFFNGYHWCTEIRKISKIPIIFISSTADNMNIVMAMNMGADDFIAKPFDLNVLTAKVQALIRRSYDFGGQTNLMEHKGAILDYSACTITFNNEHVELTKNENKILQILFEHKGKPVSRDNIMTRLWESDSYIDDNTLTVNVTRLRKKLESIGLIDFILTKKGLGYFIGD